MPPHDSGSLNPHPGGDKRLEKTPPKDRYADPETLMQLAVVVTFCSLYLLAKCLWSIYRWHRFQQETREAERREDLTDTDDTEDNDDDDDDIVVIGCFNIVGSISNGDDDNVPYKQVVHEHAD